MVGDGGNLPVRSYSGSSKFGRMGMVSATIFMLKFDDLLYELCWNLLGISNFRLLRICSLVLGVK